MNLKSGLTGENLLVINNEVTTKEGLYSSKIYYFLKTFQSCIKISVSWVVKLYIVIMEGYMKSIFSIVNYIL